MADARIPKLLQCHDRNRSIMKMKSWEPSQKDKFSYLAMGNIHGI